MKFFIKISQSISKGKFFFIKGKYTLSYWCVINIFVVPFLVDQICPVYQCTRLGVLTIKDATATIRPTLGVNDINEVPTDIEISDFIFEFSILDDFSDDEKYLMMSEGRPKTMQWIILYPKKIK